MFDTTCDILKTQGDAGIVVNTEKLQYYKRQVLFAGYKINFNGYSLVGALFEKLRKFPMPMTKMAIRAWFGWGILTKSPGFWQKWSKTRGEF